MNDYGLRALSAAVLTRAVKDATGRIDERAPSKRARREIMADAKEFLDPKHETLQLFCAVLDYEPDAFIEAAKRRGRLLANDRRRWPVLEPA